MGKTPERPRNPGAVILTIDLSQYADSHGWHWTVDCERPGRDGRFSRTWDGRTFLAADQAEDLAAWVANSVTNALVLWGGIQEVMPTD